MVSCEYGVIVLELVFESFDATAVETLDVDVGVPSDVVVCTFGAVVVELDVSSPIEFDLGAVFGIADNLLFGRVLIEFEQCVFGSR